MSVISLLPVRSEAQSGTDLTLFSITHRDNSSHVSWLCLRTKPNRFLEMFCKTESISSIFACIHKPNCGRARRVAHTKRQQCTYKPHTPIPCLREHEALSSQSVYPQRPSNRVQAQPNSCFNRTDQSVEQSHLPAKQLSHAHEVAAPVHARG